MTERRRPIQGERLKTGKYPSMLFAPNERTDNLDRLGLLKSYIDAQGLRAPEGLEQDHHFWNLTLDRYTREARIVRRGLREKLPDTEEATRREMARRIALESALNQAEAIIAIDKLRLTDGLTGAWSRLALDTYLTHLIKKEKKTPSDNPFDPRYTGLLFLDLDDFKGQNDESGGGHDNGDRVLVETVKAIKTQIREEFDMVGRYGGDEFAVILPNIPSVERLVEKAQEISKAVKRSAGITLSIGVAIVKPEDDEPKDVYKRADKGVYEAKKYGKDRVAMLIHTEDNGEEIFYRTSKNESHKEYATL